MSHEPNVSRLLGPSRSEVIIREDVVETPDDPRPNAFYDAKLGKIRVYHGPVYGNPFSTLAPAWSRSLPVGARAENAGSWALVPDPSFTTEKDSQNMPGAWQPSFNPIQQQPIPTPPAAQASVVAEQTHTNIRASESAPAPAAAPAAPASSPVAAPPPQLYPAWGGYPSMPWIQHPPPPVWYGHGPGICSGPCCSGLAGQHWNHTPPPVWQQAHQRHSSSSAYAIPPQVPIPAGPNITINNGGSPNLATHPGNSVNPPTRQPSPANSNHPSVNGNTGGNNGWASSNNVGGTGGGGEHNNNNCVSPNQGWNDGGIRDNSAAPAWGDPSAAQDMSNNNNGNNSGGGNWNNNQGPSPQSNAGSWAQGTGPIMGDGSW